MGASKKHYVLSNDQFDFSMQSIDDGIKSNDEAMGGSSSSYTPHVFASPTKSGSPQFVAFTESEVDIINSIQFENDSESRKEIILAHDESDLSSIQGFNDGNKSNNQIARVSILSSPASAPEPSRPNEFSENIDNFQLLDVEGISVRSW